MPDNPYSSPTPDTPSETAASPLSADSIPTLGEIAKQTFLAWEKLRIAYIVSLGLLTVLLAGPNLTNLRTLIMITEGAIVANVCYFAGPVTETYVRWLGYDRKWVRWFLFGGGLLLTALLVFATMASMLLPDQD